MNTKYIDFSHDERSEALFSFLVNDGYTKEEMDHNKFKVNDDDTSYIDLDGENVNESYMVLTDEEAENKCNEYIWDNLWSFQAKFLQYYMPLEVQHIEKIQELYEDANDILVNLVTNKGGLERDAKLADGRGHFLASYDGAEEEYSNYFIYRC